MHIGHQMAGRDILNYENSGERVDPDLLRRLDEVENALRQAVRSGSLDAAGAIELKTAAQEVVAAASEPTSQPSRLRRAAEVLKNLCAATVSTAGLAEAVDKMVRLATGT